MTITQHGVFCDVCNEYIFPEFEDDTFVSFSVEGISQILHAHKFCGQAVKNAGTDWKKLPEGRLRKVYENYEKKLRLTLNNVKEVQE